MIDDVRHGALNLYATAPDVFNGDEIHFGRSFAAQAGVVMAYARSYWNAKTASEHPQAALAHRAEIEQAEGIIIGSTGATPDAAFEVLVKHTAREPQTQRCRRRPRQQQGPPPQQQSGKLSETTEAEAWQRCVASAARTRFPKTDGPHKSQPNGSEHQG